MGDYHYKRGNKIFRLALQIASHHFNVPLNLDDSCTSSQASPFNEGPHDAKNAQAPQTPRRNAAAGDGPVDNNSDDDVTLEDIEIICSRGKAAHAERELKQGMHDTVCCPLEMHLTNIISQISRCWEEQILNRSSKLPVLRYPVPLRRSYRRRRSCRSLIPEVIGRATKVPEVNPIRK
jgi:hypothetical protein